MCAPRRPEPLEAEPKHVDASHRAAGRDDHAGTPGFLAAWARAVSAAPSTRRHRTRAVGVRQAHGRTGEPGRWERAAWSVARTLSISRARRPEAGATVSAVCTSDRRSRMSDRGVAGPASPGYATTLRASASNSAIRGPQRGQGATALVMSRRCRVPRRRRQAARGRPRRRSRAGAPPRRSRGSGPWSWSAGATRPGRPAVGRRPGGPPPC